MTGKHYHDKQENETVRHRQTNIDRPRDKDTGSLTDTHRETDADLQKGTKFCIQNDESSLTGRETR